MKVIAVANQKGGCAKTTTVGNIGVCLAERGYKTLLIDLDPQGNLTTSLGIEKSKLKTTMYEVMISDGDEETFQNAIISTAWKNLWLAPSTLNLASAEVELVNHIGREAILLHALHCIEHPVEYDIVIIDTPPSLGIFTLNALVAATHVLIPVQAEFFALEGMAQLLNTINLVRRRLNHELEILGMVVTMYDSRTKSSKEILEDVRKHFPKETFKTIIRRNVTVTDATMVGEPVVIYKKDSPAAQDYETLTGEIVERLGLKK
ncbi:MAG: AAA family ATPase [Thermoplasmata archaeon]